MRPEQMTRKTLTIYLCKEEVQDYDDDDDGGCCDKDGVWPGEGEGGDWLTTASPRRSVY